jgi:hypothetical protein
MTNAEIINGYFGHFFAGKARHSEVRQLLTEDFKFRDPLMSADSAEDYVNQFKSFGDVLDMRANIKAIIGEGDIVAALVDFDEPAGKMPYSQWFTFRNAKIAGLQVIYDPRPFMES